MCSNQTHIIFRRSFYDQFILQFLRIFRKAEVESMTAKRLF